MKIILFLLKRVMVEYLIIAKLNLTIELTEVG
ncbi:hypothetical protein BJV40_001392 [Clostridium beijerinckii]|nr:hypothetical protein [Clostridium beijerinckii]